MSSGPLRVSIVGGGIGGLSAANALRQRGMEVTVFEQADALGEVGAGVFMSPNSLRNLQRLGAGERLAVTIGKIAEGSQYYRMDGTVVGPILTTDSFGNPVGAMHRADLLDALAAGLPPEVVHTGHRCVGFEQTAESARLTFANGVTAESDVVIAADGIHSALQKYVVEPSKPIHSGSLAYRGLIPREKAPEWKKEVSQLWMGDKKHFLVYPVRRGELINYVAFVPTTRETEESWSAIGDRDQLAAAFQGWDPAVVKLLDRVETCFWWGLYDRKPLATWTNGRLALLGDAAHAMLPHLGQGANQSIEDGMALAVFLQGLETQDVADALRRYERFRRQRTDIVQAEARQNGHRYDSNYESLEQRDREIANSAQFRKWLYDYDVEKAALDYLHLGS
ncbi:MAG TPA: FAD-dependent monooxygenase [Bradyrhizobium sp.]|nr:FAD-dependent monooxygenase [Bradyrhizobium sp.]